MRVCGCKVSFGRLIMKIAVLLVLLLGKHVGNQLIILNIVTVQLNYLRLISIHLRELKFAFLSVQHFPVLSDDYSCGEYQTQTSGAAGGATVTAHR